MSEKSKNFTSRDVLDDLLVDTKYAIEILSAGRDALLESNVGKSFNGKVPKPVIMHAVSRGLTEVKMPGLARDKFYRGVISLCLFFLEDEYVNLALKMKEELGGEDAD